MAIASSIIFREPDGGYTTVVQHGEAGRGGDMISETGVNQTLTNAFNKGRDDLAGLLTGGVTARRVVILLEYS